MVAGTCEAPELFRAKTDSGRLGGEEADSVRTLDTAETGRTIRGALLEESAATRDTASEVGSESESDIPVRSTCTTSFGGDDADKSARVHKPLSRRKQQLRRTRGWKV